MSQAKRPCARCGKPWSVEAFRAVQTSYCRECVTAKARLRRADPKIRARETERAREKRRENPNYVVAAREYYQRNRAASMKRTNKWRTKNPEKSRAIITVSRAVNDTYDLERGRCESCGTDKNVCAFPIDISNPLRVNWRCRFCDNELRRQAAAAPSSNEASDHDHHRSS
jgi:hypothetical protein